MTRALVAFLLVAAAVLMLIHQRAESNPLLIEAKAPAQQDCPAFFVQHPCAQARCGSPESRTA